MLTIFTGYTLQQLYGKAVNTSFFTKIIWANITFMGDAFFALATVFFILFFAKQKQHAGKLLCSILLVLFLVQLIKNIFSGLPIQLFFEANSNIADYSLPVSNNILSSHSAVAITLASFFVIYTNKWGVKIGASVLALLVCTSRLYTVNDSVISIISAIIPALFATLLVHVLSTKVLMQKNYFKKSMQRSKGSNNNHYLPV